MGGDMTIAMARAPHTGTAPLWGSTLTDLTRLTTATRQRLGALTDDALAAASDNLGFTNEEDDEPNVVLVREHLHTFARWFIDPHTIEREIAIVTLDRVAWVVSGGMSYGDAPTDAYDVIHTADFFGIYNAPIP